MNEIQLNPDHKSFLKTTIFCDHGHVFLTFLKKVFVHLCMVVWASRHSYVRRAFLRPLRARCISTDRGVN